MLLLHYFGYFLPNIRGLLAVTRMLTWMVVTLYDEIPFKFHHYLKYLVVLAINIIKTMKYFRVQMIKIFSSV